jgi:chemotaxis protein methyltransferase CheR
MPLAAETFEDVRRFVRHEAAIVLEADKEYLVEARLSPVARKAGAASVADFVAQAIGGRDVEARRKLIEAMTTNETSFFRDVAPFEVFRKTALPDVLARRAASRTLNLWCGAASSGQEPYSIAMTLADHFPETAGWNVKFLATDLSEEMLSRCREGSYSQFEVNRGLPATALVKHFERKGLNWTANAALKARIEFAPLNLAKPWAPMPPWDVVFLRNVLIYFDVPTKREILQKIRRACDPQAWLFLGAAETPIGVDDGWERVPVDRASCWRPKS